MADLEQTIKGLEEWINCPFPMDAEIDPELVHESLELLQQFRWIPVSERPPEEETWVNVQYIEPGTGKKIVTVGEYVMCGDSLYPEDHERLLKIWEVLDYSTWLVVECPYVTHWMPLPPPTEGGKQV